MSTGVRLADVLPKQPSLQWKLVTLVAFRFCFVYLGLYCLSTSILSGLFPFPNVDIPDLDRVWPMRPVVLWVASHVFHAGSPSLEGLGSGDTTYDWVFSFCLLVFACIAAVLWSILDRRRMNYAALHKWFRLAIRFSLALTMLSYGLIKAPFPLQMPRQLFRLVEPFGQFSPMGLLWASMAAAPGYQILAGCAEVLGGILLIIPRTTALGALVCLADLTNVFVLNMTYDMDVKLFSFHLLLLAVFLLAPDFKRLGSFFVFHRPVEPAGEYPLFASRRANRVALVSQLFLGLWLIVMNGYSIHTEWRTFMGNTDPLLYGIWSVDLESIDGEVHPLLLTDSQRLNHVVFESFPRVVFLGMDGSLVRHQYSVKAKEKVVAITDFSDKTWKVDFTFERPAPDQLTLDGSMDGHKLHLHCKRVDPNSFLLVNHGFHWIQDQPFNR